MILDTSAIVAVLLQEPERTEFIGRIENASWVGVGAPTLAEASVVLTRRTDDPRLLEGFLVRTLTIVVPFEREHWLAAAHAWSTFGKGRHPAQLNFGDCLAYATAKVAGEPLLCKGDDFAKTDIELA